MKRYGNSFLTFCLSLIPGAAHMYLGMMHKGIVLMSATLLCGALAAMINIPILLIPMPVIWFYSFFDAFATLRKDPEQRAREDAGILAGIGNWIKLDMVKFVIKRQNWVGIGLVFLGCWILYQNFSQFIWHTFEIPFLRDLMSGIPTLLVAGAIIGVGVAILRKERKNAPDYRYGRGSNDHRE